MGLQGVFDFCLDEPARPKRPERLFFAVVPELEASLQIGRMVDGFIAERELKGARIRADRLHISLHHIGDYKRLKSATVYAAKLAGDAVSARPFDMEFHAAETFDTGRDRRPLVLLGQGDALFAFQEILGSAMQKNGLRPAGDFKPHMTLLYGSTKVPQQPIDPIRLHVKGFTLIHSEVGRTKYNLLHRWSLTARD